MPDIQMVRWAEADDAGKLMINTKPRPFLMKCSEGTGEGLLSSNGFGADIIHFGAGRGVGSHIHEGDHILFVLAGEGYVTYCKERYELKPGVAYFVPGEIAHAIDATTDLVLIAVGNKHVPVDSTKRMDLVAHDK